MRSGTLPTQRPPEWSGSRISACTRTPRHLEERGGSLDMAVSSGNRWAQAGRTRRGGEATGVRGAREA
jgi:hypothetical protein